MKVRHDLQRKGIKPHLWIIVNPKRGGKMLKLATLYMLTNVEFDTFTSVIENLKTPLGHVSAMAQFIRRKTFKGLKSHDYHVSMQQILPLGLRGLLDSRPSMAIMRISNVFWRICNKVWNPLEIESL